MLCSKYHLVLSNALSFHSVIRGRSNISLHCHVWTCVKILVVYISHHIQIMVLIRKRGKVMSIILLYDGGKHMLSIRSILAMQLFVKAYISCVLQYILGGRRRVHVLGYT